MLQRVDLQTVISLPIVTPGSEAPRAWARVDSSASDVRLALCTGSYRLLWDMLANNLGAAAQGGQGGGEGGGPGFVMVGGEGKGGGAAGRGAEATAQSANTSAMASDTESACECMALSFALSGLELDVRAATPLSAAHCPLCSLPFGCLSLAPTPCSLFFC
jgi:hypothetical protein